MLTVPPPTSRIAHRRGLWWGAVVSGAGSAHGWWSPTVVRALPPTLMLRCGRQVGGRLAQV